MTIFVVPKPEGEKKENRFDFKITTKSYSIPKLPFVSGDTLAYLSGAGRDDTIARMVCRIVEIECPDAADEMRGLSADQCLAFWEAYRDAGSAPVGESSASEN